MNADRLLECFFAELPGEAPTMPGSVSAGFVSAFDVDALADASTRAAVGAALGGGTVGSAALPALLDPAIIRATFSTQVAVDGNVPQSWAELSGYYETADDRWIQFHANFAHHAAGIVARLGCSPDRPAVEAAVRAWTADDLEAALVADGMIAAKLRTIEEWDGHPHAVATARLPLVTATPLGGPPGDVPDVAPASFEGLQGVRVLDTTRVLAGPIASQTLAGFGADVLRIGAQHLPTVAACVLATGAGKRNAWLDLRDPNERERFTELARTADVWIDGYRPGAFAGFGFDDDWICENRRGKVTVQVSGFDWIGPWAGRRGFDSIVQSTTGIVEAGRAAAHADGPTPLPVQALDYATGYFAAAAAGQLLRHRSAGTAWLARLSLLRTRNALVSLGGPSPFTPVRPDPEVNALVDYRSPTGTLTVPKPLVGDWPAPPALDFADLGACAWGD